MSQCEFVLHFLPSHLHIAWNRQQQLALEMFVKSEHGSDLSIDRIKEIKREATKWINHSRTEMQCSVKCRKLSWDQCNAFEFLAARQKCGFFALDESKLQQLNGSGLFLRQKDKEGNRFSPIAYYSWATNARKFGFFYWLYGCYTHKDIGKKHACAHTHFY